MSEARINGSDSKNAVGQHLETPGQIGPVLPARPVLRGVLHGVSFVAAIAIGTLLIVFARESRVLPAAVFAVSAALMLGTSALYHRVTWSPGARLWMRRADHAGIFLLIAGTYTPVALISLSGVWRTIVLAVVWSGALAGATSKFCWVGAPRWLSALIGLALGWIGVILLPQLAHSEGIAPVILLAAGGFAYTVGAVIYAIKRPDPFPRVFGYHEVFHAFTIVALACQYVAVAIFVVQVA
jgi:hemolysin III